MRTTVGIILGILLLGASVFIVERSIIAGAPGGDDFNRKISELGRNGETLRTRSRVSGISAHGLNKSNAVARIREIARYLRGEMCRCLSFAGGHGGHRGFPAARSRSCCGSSPPLRNTAALARNRFRDSRLMNRTGGRTGNAMYPASVPQSSWQEVGHVLAYTLH